MQEYNSARELAVGDGCTKRCEGWARVGRVSGQALQAGSTHSSSFHILALVVPAQRRNPFHCSYGFHNRLQEPIHLMFVPLHLLWT